MKKTIFIFLIVCLIFTACKNQEKYEQKSEFEFKEKISGVDVYLPDDWLTKKGVYGDYYNDIQNFILYKKIETNDIKKEVLESLNFYRNDDFKMTDELPKLYNEKNIEFERKDKLFKYIKGKNLGTVIILVGSKNKEKVNKLYEEVFK